MGMTSRRKGYRGEKEFRDLCTEKQLEVVWQAEDPCKPDVRIDEKYNVEVKFRSSVPKCVYEWLDEKKADALAMRRVSTKEKGNPWLIVMRFDEWVNVLQEIKDLNETIDVINYNNDFGEEKDGRLETSEDADLCV